MKFKLIAAMMLLAGCTAQNRYVEGTMTQLGAYLPYDGQLVGVEVVNYMNGCKVTSASNCIFSIDRSFTATNDYFWGMVKTSETTKTKVDVK